MAPYPSSSDDDDDFDYYPGADHNYAMPVYIQKQEETKESVFLTALKDENLEAMSTMLSDGFHVDQPLFGGWSPLMHACTFGSLLVIEFLIKENANVNFNKELYTPLMALCNSTSRNEDELLKCLNLLLEHNANVNATNRDGTTALMNACNCGHLELVKRLLECDCNLNIPDSEGWSALFYAVDKNQEDIVRALIHKKARLDLIDRRKRTAYNLAVVKGHDNLIKLVCSKVEKRKLLEEEQNSSLPSKFTKEPLEHLFDQLPKTHANSTSGFSLDVGKLLCAMGLRHCVKLFESNNIQLNEFLLITDEQLKELGVRFSVHRQRILSSIKKFHLHQWNKKSLGLKPRNEQMSLDDGIKVMCNVTKHLHILNATLNYVRASQHFPLGPDMLKAGENSIHQLNLITNELKAIQLHTAQLSYKEKIEPVDLIKPKNSQSFCQKHPMLLVLSVVCLGSFLWKKKLSS